MEKTAVEIFIVMNEDGDYEVGTDESDAIERFDDNVGGSVRRMVKLTANMTPPKIIEAAVDVADEAGETTEVEAA